jgi:hypothetical protein
LLLKANECVFWKMGVAALGVGSLMLQSVYGPMLLQDFLLVPKINLPLFSVMVAVRIGVSVHSWPAGQVCIIDCI